MQTNSSFHSFHSSQPPNLAPAMFNEADGAYARMLLHLQHRAAVVRIPTTVPAVPANRRTTSGQSSAIPIPASTHTSAQPFSRDRSCLRAPTCPVSCIRAKLIFSGFRPVSSRQLHRRAVLGGRGPPSRRAPPRRRQAAWRGCHRVGKRVGGANDSCLNCIIMGIRCPNRRFNPEDDSPWAEPVGTHTSQR
jgi:hypothetical protein